MGTSTATGFEAIFGTSRGAGSLRWPQEVEQGRERLSMALRPIKMQAVASIALEAAFERLSDGERVNPNAPTLFRTEAEDPSQRHNAHGGHPPVPMCVKDLLRQGTVEIWRSILSLAALGEAGPVVFGGMELISLRTDDIQAVASQVAWAIIHDWSAIEATITEGK